MHYIKKLDKIKPQKHKSPYRPIFLILTAAWLCTLLFLSCTVCEQKAVADQVLRLHILANSDQDRDQALKLKVRDAVIQAYASAFSDQSDAHSAATEATMLGFSIRQTAQKELRRNGSPEIARVEIKKTTFPTRRYGSLSLPAGRYTAVNIRIGTALGHNWWCVLYPPLCLTDGAVRADDQTLSLLRRSLTQKEYDLITQEGTPQIQIKFRILEILKEYL